MFGSGIRLTLAKVVLFVISSGIGGVLDGLRQLFFYIESRVLYKPASFVPVSISKAVVELQPLDFGALVKLTSDNSLFVAVGFLGLVYLFAKKFKYMVT
ncbi:MAG: hypothetical protein Q9N34_03925 [Aquificota bacterium]|nr:hypothetical protein [Aquificota bacterium]